MNPRRCGLFGAEPGIPTKLPYGVTEFVSRRHISTAPAWSVTRADRRDTTPRPGRGSTMPSAASASRTLFTASSSAISFSSMTWWPSSVRTGARSRCRRCRAQRTFARPDAPGRDGTRATGPWKSVLICQRPVRSHADVAVHHHSGRCDSPHEARRPARRRRSSHLRAAAASMTADSGWGCACHTIQIENNVLHVTLRGGTGTQLPHRTQTLAPVPHRRTAPFQLGPQRGEVPFEHLGAEASIRGGGAGHQGAHGVFRDPPVTGPASPSRPS